MRSFHCIRQPVLERHIKKGISHIFVCNFSNLYLENKLCCGEIKSFLRTCGCTWKEPTVQVHSTWASLSHAFDEDSSIHYERFVWIGQRQRQSPAVRLLFCIIRTDAYAWQEIVSEGKLLILASSPHFWPTLVSFLRRCGGSHLRSSIHHTGSSALRCYAKFSPI